MYYVTIQCLVKEHGLLNNVIACINRENVTSLLYKPINDMK